MVRSASYFIRKFEAIPDEKWCVGTYYSPLTDRCCALGHLGVGRGMGQFDDAGSLIKLFGKYLSGASVPSVNDGNDARFQQTRPRARVLAALHTIKAIRLAK